MKAQMQLERVLDESGAKIFHLGCDIWLSTDDALPPSCRINSRNYIRFLDHLFIPCQTHELSRDQILIINNYRAIAMPNDDQFSYNREINDRLLRVVSVSSGAILEIGPSYFPIVPPIWSDAVLCDIDNGANNHNASIGYRTVEPCMLPHMAAESISVVLASFVFHFGLCENQANDIDRLMSKDSVIIFNVLTKSSRARTLAADKFCSLGFVFRCYDLFEFYGKEDVLFVGSKNSSGDRFQGACKQVDDWLR